MPHTLAGTSTLQVLLLVALCLPAACATDSSREIAAAAPSTAPPIAATTRGAPDAPKDASAAANSVPPKPSRARDSLDAETSPAPVFALHAPLREDQPSAMFRQRTGAPIALEPTPIVSTCDAETAQAIASDIQGVKSSDVFVRLTPAGAERFERYTERNVGRPLAIVVDGVVLAVPIIRGRMVGGNVSIAAGSMQEADDIAQRIRARKGCR